MRKPGLFLWTAMAIWLQSCATSPQTEGLYEWLPMPVQLKLSGSSQLEVSDVSSYHLNRELNRPLPAAYLARMEQKSSADEAVLLFQLGDDGKIPAEGYMLQVQDDQIIIKASDRAGLLYGWMTLLQVMQDALAAGVKLPRCSVEDAPSLSYRAIHLDMKHHREKLEYYYQLIDKLAQYKINAIIAEVEDKLAYQRRPLIGSEDALSMDEWKKLSEYAMDRNIEISPLVQGLGHASFILKHAKYRDLRDDPESDWAFNPLDSGTYELQYDLYRDALEAMPYARYLHVGGDEVHTTGRGSGLSELELQLHWLNKVCSFAADQGKTPIFWDDMPIKYAGLYSCMFDASIGQAEVEELWAGNEERLLQFLDQFPTNCIYMRWNYSHPETAGNIQAMEWFSEHGLQVMGATAGQTRWKLMPQNESNMDNIRSFAMTSVEKGIDGLLLTLWDDDSPHFELYMRGILAFAEYSWSGNRRSKEAIKAAYRHREFGPELASGTYSFVDRMEPMVSWWNSALLKKDLRNSLKSMDDPFEEGIIDLPFGSEAGSWSEQHRHRLDAALRILTEASEIEKTISSMKGKAIRNNYRLEVYEQVNALVSFPARALLALEAWDQATGAEEKQLARETLKQLQKEFFDLRSVFEEVYARTRILEKPRNYLLDQDHHRHLANQALSFDWQFGAELTFLLKLNAALEE